MTKCNELQLDFPMVKHRKVECRFGGGEITSDGGVLLAALADRKLGLTAALARVLPDHRAAGKVKHTLRDLLRQRIYGIAQGWEDLNDHQSLRGDTALQTAVGRDDTLASAATLCRLENKAARHTTRLLHRVLVETFIKSFKEPPKELILDFDATDDRVHGNQEGAFYHGYYGDWCFLPLYVFCGEQLLVSLLRPASTDAARGAWSVLRLLAGRLREAFPGVRLIFRGDSGFCRWRMLRWCERNDIGYIVGLARNARLEALLAPTLAEAEAEFKTTQLKVRKFAELSYAAQSWDQERRVIGKAEHSVKGANPRFILTNLQGEGQQLYDKVYCARGEMENRIKEQQLDLFADRTSCHAWWANQFRLLLSSCAYVLIETIRRLGLKGTTMAKAQCGTIRLKLLKIGAVVLRNTRRVQLLWSSSFPNQGIFAQAWKALSSA
jgi:hypothetical protein